MERLICLGYLVAARVTVKGDLRGGQMETNVSAKWERSVYDAARWHIVSKPKWTAVGSGWRRRRTDELFIIRWLEHLTDDNSVSGKFRPECNLQKWQWVTDGRLEKLFLRRRWLKFIWPVIYRRGSEIPTAEQARVRLMSSNRPHLCTWGWVP